jgi:hypothetical protein
MEPIQAAVRTVIDRGVFELLSGLQVQGAGDACLASTEFVDRGPAGHARYRRPGDPS